LRQAATWSSLPIFSTRSLHWRSATR
jgi:hypothetical protein